MTSKGNRLIGLLATILVASSLWPAAAGALTYPVYDVELHGSGAGYLSGNGFVSATSDSGSAWSSAITGRHMYGVASTSDGGSAMAVGDALDGLRVTANSGRTWTAEGPLLTRDVREIRGVAYLNGGRRVVVGRMQSPKDAAFIASAVGAGSWSVDLEGPLYYPPDEDTEPTPTHASMAAVDAAPGGSVAWAAGTNFSLNPQATLGEALVYKTVDSGSHWVTQTVAGSYDISCVAAVDADVAFVGSTSNRVLRTTDGGATWTPLIPGVAVRAIDAVDANTVVVAGDAGKIAWTTNASAATPAWTVRTNVTTNALLGVDALDAAHWIVVGDRETILRTADGGATWSGSVVEAAPAVTFTNPTPATLLSHASIIASGTAGDGLGVGVAKVEVRLRRADGQYWTGSSWSASETWLPASSDDGWKTWEAAVLPDTSSAGGGATLSVRSTDGFGLVSPTVSIATNASTALTPRAASVVSAYNSYVSIGGALTSGPDGVSGKTVRLLSAGGSVLAAATTGADGSFSFSVRPSVKTAYVLSFAGDGSHAASSAQVSVTPKAYVGRPGVPSSVKRSRYFKVYADLKPRHTAGSRAMTFTFERWQRTSTGKYGWVRLKTASAKAADYSSYSRCTLRLKLSKGSWRVKATHSDSGHAETLSSWRSFKVR